MIQQDVSKESKIPRTLKKSTSKTNIRTSKVKTIPKLILT